MENFKNVDDVLEFVVTAEQKAFNLYTKLATQSRSSAMSSVFEQYAGDAMRHKMQIEKIKHEKSFSIPEGLLARLKPNDYIVKNEFSRDINYIDALSLAIERAKAQYKLYIHLSEHGHGDDEKKMLHSMAVSVADHNTRFEIEHDAYIASLN